MNRSSSVRSLALPGAALLVSLVALAFLAGNAFGRAGDPGSPSVSAPPSAAPSTPAPSTPAPSTPAPSIRPSVAPSDDLSDGVITVALDIATPHDVSVLIEDVSGSLVGASSGRAGDGMSVRWYEMAVENVDADTLRVTWSGFPADDELELGIVDVDGTISLQLVQQGPPLNSDGLGFDRVLILDFDHPVDAGKVLTSVEGALASA
ncbi:MAG TPA: hypothetical protein VK871_00930 [Candidatus Limnocylindrales bacterium]|nr:hypothetical protein [Candidatus Limnocylindrales bacterium]